jgi:5-deoxy-glucuronate isomerase
MKSKSHNHLLLKCKNAFGLNQVIPLNNNILPNIGFAVLKAAQNETFRSDTYNKEICLVILSGKWKINIGKDEFVCERTNVFDQKPCALYLPSHTEFILRAEEDGEIALCESHGSNGKKVIFIPQSKVKERHLGSDNFQRIALDILHEDRDANFLLVGETISRPGNWSSFPPHKHDTDNMPHESALEELYFFMFKPKDGFGIQRIYTDDRSADESFLIEDRSVVLIPFGYHPVVASPGYALYYLWVLAGEKRLLKPYFDPAYKWIDRTD